MCFCVSTQFLSNTISKFSPYERFLESHCFPFFLSFPQRNFDAINLSVKIRSFSYFQPPIDKCLFISISMLNLNNRLHFIPFNSHSEN